MRYLKSILSRGELESTDRVTRILGKPDLSLVLSGAFVLVVEKHSQRIIQDDFAPGVLQLFIKFLNESCHANDSYHTIFYV